MKETTANKGTPKFPGVWSFDSFDFRPKYQESRSQESIPTWSPTNTSAATKTEQDRKAI